MDPQERKHTAESELKHGALRMSWERGLMGGEIAVAHCEGLFLTKISSSVASSGDKEDHIAMA